MARRPAIPVDTSNGIGDVAFTLSGQPDTLSLVDNGDGSAEITGTVAAGEAATSPYTTTVTATDDADETDSESFTITVVTVLALDAIANQEFIEGTAVTPVGVSVTSGTGASPYVLSASGLPSGLTFTDDSDGTGSISGTPATGTSSGSPYTVTITAVDGAGQSDTETFDVDVAEPFSGIYYLVDLNNRSSLLSYDEDAGTTDTVAISPVLATNPLGISQHPTTENIWVADDTGDQISEYTSDMQSRVSGVATATRVRSMAFDAAGTLWTMVAGTGVYTVNLSTGATSLQFSVGGTSAKRGIAFDLSDNLWISNNTSTQFERVNKSTGAVLETVAYPAGIAASIGTFVFNGDGNIIAYNAGDNEIQRVDISDSTLIGTPVSVGNREDITVVQ